MTQRMRKLAGTVALLVLVAVYVLFAAWAAVALEISASKSVAVAYYVLAGLAWVIPAGILIRWMQRPD